MLRPHARLHLHASNHLERTDLSTRCWHALSSGYTKSQAFLILQHSLHARMTLSMSTAASVYGVLACALLWPHQNASMCKTAALASHAYDLEHVNFCQRIWRAPPSACATLQEPACKHLKCSTVQCHRT